MELVRRTIMDLKEYKPNYSAYKIKLDANEGKNLFFGNDDIKCMEAINISLYPDSSSLGLRQEIGKYININPSNIIAGNGSSEMIELIMKTYIDKDDIVLGFTPSFSMYSIFSQIYSAKFIGVRSNDDFSLSIDNLIEKAKEVNPKIIIICNPNNPTGYLIDKSQIKRLIESVNSIVVLDEAYIEFADGSMVGGIYSYNNLIVLRTLSKAFGLAGLRLGYLVAGESIIGIINKVKSPYNLNAISQYFGIKALKSSNKVKDYIEKVKTQRDYLYKELKKLGLTVYPSHGNFLFFKSNKESLNKILEKQGILIRNFSEELDGYYRVSVGSPWENKEFIKILKGILKNENS